jgi:hypothetical protein
LDIVPVNNDINENVGRKKKAVSLDDTVSKVKIMEEEDKKRNI